MTCRRELGAPGVERPRGMRAAGTERTSTTRGEEALTLVELLVAAALTAVILAAGYASLIVAVQSLHRSEIQTENIDTLRIAIAAVSRDLRAADSPLPTIEAFEVAEPDRVHLYSRVGATPQVMRVEAEVDTDGQLWLTRTPVTVDTDGSLVVDSAAEQRRVVARNLVDDQIFTYLPAGDGTPLDDLEDVEQRRRIRMVTISMRVASDGGVRARPTELATTVRTPNLLAE